MGADSSQTEAFLRGVTSHLDETGAGKILDDYILRIEDYPIKKPLTGVQRVKILPEGTPDDVSGYAAEINIGRTPDPDTVGRYDQLLRTQRSEPLKPSEFDELKAIEKEYPSIKKWLEPGWEPTDRPLVTTG